MNALRRLAVHAAAMLGLCGVAVATAADHQVLVVRLAYQGDHYALRDARVVASPVPLRARAVHGATLHYSLLDAKGRTLSVHAAPDPRLLRAPLSPPGEPFAGHLEARREAGEFVLRLPYRPEGRALRLEQALPGHAKPRVQVLALPAR